MTSYLFVTWDGGGNVPPALAIAGQLRDRGHDVRVMGHPQQQTAVAESGLRFEAYRHAAPWSSTTPVGSAQWALKYLKLFTSTSGAVDVAEALEREPADLVVADCMLLSALRAAQARGVPNVALMHTVYRYLGGGWNRGPVGTVARLKGMSPTRLWRTADLSILTGLADLDPAASLPPNLRFTGPVWPQGRPAPQLRTPEADRHILVSLSSIFYVGQAAVLQSIMDAVADLPVSVVVTTGHGTAPDEVRAPANVTVHRFVPHSELMPSASLLVGHAGHSTTMQALSHNLPMVLLPLSPIGDQPHVAKAVARQGAAVVLKPKASAADIRAAITRMLADGPHRVAAARLGAGIRAADGAVTAADLIEKVR